LAGEPAEHDPLCARLYVIGLNAAPYRNNLRITILS